MPDPKRPRLVVAADAGVPAETEDPPPVPPDEPPPAPNEPVVLRRARAPGGGEYQARESGLWFVRDEVEICISNFDAELIRRARRSDRTDLVVRARIGGEERELTLSSARYESLRWITDSVPGGVLAPVPAARARLLAAIALLSAPAEVRVVEHLGWVRDARERWVYVHAGGGIGADGHVDVEVAVEQPLDRFRLDDAENEAAVPLGLLDLAPDRLMVTLLAAVVHGVLGGPEFALHLHGVTGTGKSQLAAIAQSFHGREMATGTGLPANWSSTANATEWIAHAAKDCLLVVDDWVPGTIQGSEIEMDRLVRALSGASGRARLGTPARPPRSLLLSTGEALPRLPSLLARLVAVRVGTGDVAWDRLTVAQERARAGLHSGWLRSFIRWAAPRLDELRRRLDIFVHEGRRRWSSFGVHARTVDALANLEAAWRTLTGYVWSTDQLTLERAAEIVRRGQAALVEVAREQERVQVAGDPVRLFLATLREMIATGTVRIGADVREIDDGSSSPLVGWMRDREVLLDPGAVLAAVQDHVAQHAGAVDLSEQQLAKLLRESGVLQRVDGRGSKVRYAVRVTAGGQRRRVWALSARGLDLQEGDPGGPPAR